MLPSLLNLDRKLLCNTKESLLVSHSLNALRIKALLLRSLEINRLQTTRLYRLHITQMGSHHSTIFGVSPSFSTAPRYTAGFGLYEPNSSAACAEDMRKLQLRINLEIIQQAEIAVAERASLVDGV